VLTLTLLDALPLLSLEALEEWLPLSADLVNMIEDQAMRNVCKERFWEVLSSGEMDVERANLCVGWWGTKGGREKVLFGRAEEDRGPYMSGGLGDRSRL